MHHMQQAPKDIREILNLVVDSYCFRVRDIKDMDFFRLKLVRLMDNATTRQREMQQLLNNCWWKAEEKNVEVFYVVVVIFFSF